MQEHRARRYLHVFLLRLGEHILGQIHPNHRQPPPGKELRHRAGAAGQVSGCAGADILPLQNFKIKIYRVSIVDIPGQAVIAGSKSFVRIHK